MTAPFAFRLATYLLALDGLAALHMAGLIGTPGSAAVVGAIAASWWRDRAGARLGAAPRLHQAVIVLAAAASALDLLYLAESLLDGFVRLLLFLLLYRLFTRRSLRDARDVGFLSFFMLVAASSVTFDVEFLLVFLVFLVLGVWAFMLHHVLSESARFAGLGTRATAERAPLGPTLLGLSLAASGATLAITALFFFVIPRVGQAALPLRARLGAMVLGFSDRVELGAFGEIASDPSIIMRVRFPEGPSAPDRLSSLRWRGIAFDHFDGRAWKAVGVERSTVSRSAGQFAVSRFRGAGPFVVQEVYLEPTGTDVIFAAPRVLSVDLPAPSITVDDMGSLSVPTPSARLRYVVYSELEPPPGRARSGDGATLGADERERYLQLPPLSPRVADLARTATAGGRDPYAAALRLTSFLSRQYRYTLTLSRPTEPGPLEEFLFVRRSGNCEYFATALAVMLRTLGMPTRLVNGFQRGEWNPYGRYFMVRQRDAHSWVEAYVDGLGWVTLDPTPRADQTAAWGPGRLSFYLDALRLRWYRSVVNWSLRDQVTVAAALQRQTAAWREEALGLGRWWAGADRPGLLGGVLLVGVGLAAALRYRRGPRPAPRVPAFYARALRVLARRGFRPAPGETAREFLARVTAAAPTCAAPLAGLTGGYERVRFGSAAPPPEASVELGAWLAELERPSSP